MPALDPVLQSCFTYATEHFGRSFFSLPFFSIVSTILTRIGGATSGGVNCSVRSGSEKAVKIKRKISQAVDECNYFYENHGM